MEFPIHDVSAPLPVSPSPTPSRGVGRVFLIGGGPGAADLITLRAVAALQAADVVLLDDLVNPALLSHCRPGIPVVSVGKRGHGRATPQTFIHRLMWREARRGRTVARLKGGDPLVFGRGGEEAAYLAERGVAVAVIPGISAGMAVPASLGIPVTHRECTHGVTLITAHTRAHAEPDWAALAATGTTLVIYMGLSRLASICTGLRQGGMPGDMPVAVISQGTWASQAQVLGTLEDIVPRAEAAALPAPALIVVGRVIDYAWAQALPGQAPAIAEVDTPSTRCAA